MKEKKKPGEVTIVSGSLIGCKGIIKECRASNIGNKHVGCYVIEFTYVPDNYFELPCTQVIDKKHVNKPGE